MRLNANWVNSDETNLIIDAIEKFGGQARFVGGCVRDAILKRDVHDIDLATDLLPKKMIQALMLRGIKTIPTGLKYGTVTAILNNKPFEITTLRRDVKCDGRHADVEFTNDWQIDASRRDFTFNALYANRYGHVYDYFNGIGDLKARKLNFIGNAEDRIKEDYLRILRAFRFHAKICTGDLSDEILSVCQKYSHMVQNLSGERIRDEIFKLLECGNPYAALQGMKKSTVLQKIIPQEVKCEVLFSGVRVDPLLRLALLLRTASTDLGKHVSKFLRLSHHQQKKLLFLLSHNISIKLSEKEQKKYISLYGTELYCDLIKILGIESSKDVDQYISFASTFKIPEFPISGKDLINIGYQQGKLLGISLKLIKNHWENSAYALTKGELLNHARDIIKDKI